MTLRACFVFCCLFSSKIFNSSVCIAQKIELKDVAKIECVINPGVMRMSFGTVEVVPEKNVWKSYQTKFYQPYDKNMRPYTDSTRKFLKAIPNSKLIQLLAAITKPDSAIKYDAFDINIEDMVKLSDDSIVNDIKSNQRLEFNKALRSRSVVQKVIQESFVPTNLFYNYQYSITITTKSNKSYHVNGLAFQSLYHMPWVINNVKV